MCCWVTYELLFSQKEEELHPEKGQLERVQRGNRLAGAACWVQLQDGGETQGEHGRSRDLGEMAWGDLDSGQMLLCLQTLGLFPRSRFTQIL